MKDAVNRIFEICFREDRNGQVGLQGEVFMELSTWPPMPMSSGLGVD